MASHHPREKFLVFVVDGLGGAGDDREGKEGGGEQSGAEGEHDLLSVPPQDRMLTDGATLRLLYGGVPINIFDMPRCTSLARLLAEILCHGNSRKSRTILYDVGLVSVITKA